MTFDELVTHALTLPGVTLGTSYGTLALRSGKTLIARLRAEEGDLVLKVEDGLREVLLETQPKHFYTTSHYAGYPTLLVRLADADLDQITGLFERAIAVATSKSRRPR